MKEILCQLEEPGSLAGVIADAIREPLLVLDGDLDILFASGSFHRSFQIAAEGARGRPVFALDNGAWDLPALRLLLQRTALGHCASEGTEIARDFPRIGHRVLLFHARPATCGGDRRAIVLGLEDVTERRAIEREKAHLQSQTDDLLQQKQMLFEEMEHRIANSLQIVASILMLKARVVTSAETRQHLHDAHRRILSVAAVQQHLHSAGRGERIEVAPYLSTLSASLAESMVGESRPAMLKVIADDGKLASAQAVSLGLIVTELVINALKYAFPNPGPADAVTIRYEVNGTDWMLSVSDNGVGSTAAADARGGLGTSLVKALAQQLDAQIETTSGLGGTRVSIAHSTFVARLSQVA
jgi:two-component sensor histidine kinase